MAIDWLGWKHLSSDEAAAMLGANRDVAVDQRDNSVSVLPPESLSGPLDMRQPETFSLAGTKLERVMFHRCAFTTEAYRIILDRCRFEYSVLATFDFRRSSIMSSEFKGSNLIRSVFNDALLSDVVFEECDLAKASFVGVELRGVQFRNCRFWGTDFTEIHADDLAVNNGSGGSVFIDSPEVEGLEEIFDGHEILSPSDAN